MGKRRKTVVEPIDPGTYELSQRHKLRPEKKYGGAVHIRVLDGNEIDKLLWSDQISPDEHSTLVGFQVDLHRASLLGPRCSVLEARVSGRQHDVSQAEAMARLKVNQTIGYLQKHVGCEQTNQVVDLCLSDRFARDLVGLRRSVDSLVSFRDLWLRTGHQAEDA